MFIHGFFLVPVGVVFDNLMKKPDDFLKKNCIYKNLVIRENTEIN